MQLNKTEMLEDDIVNLIAEKIRDDKDWEQYYSLLETIEIYLYFSI